MSPTAQYLVQSGVTLLGVVALALLIYLASRRLGVSPIRGPMQLLGRLQLEPRRAVCLVKIGEKVLVLGTSEAGVTKLAELAEGEVPKGASEAPRRFSDVLREVTGRPPSPPFGQKPTVGSEGSDP